VPGETPPARSSYRSIALEPGYNYIPARDGTTLSAFVTLPGPIGDGPYPTLVEYSGYSPSDPTATQDPSRLLVPALGFALVQVNVRGTGCSGGSFDAFERIQSIDGYDVIETVAAQDWSTGVGMFGVSYPGIMQLHVASTRPPSLAAITPLSVTDGVDSVLYPGGIYNNGFGEEWTGQVGGRAGAGGQAWAVDRIEQGDTICAGNQRLRVHNPDLVQSVKATPFVTDLSRDRSARTYAADIEVPTLIGGAWQDEQTGGRFPALIGELSNARPLRAVLYNGLHVDAISGQMLVELVDFLNLYVAQRPPRMDPLTRTVIGFGLGAVFGQALTVPASGLAGLSYEEAKERYEAEPPIEILFEQGAVDPNLPVPGFRIGFDQWPPRVTLPTELYLTGPADDPMLRPEPPSGEVALRFTTDPDEGQRTTLDDLSAIWSNRPGWNWPAPAAENSIVASTDALDEDLVLVGNLSADLWVSLDGGSDAPIEVTVSEVAPDGSETYVQTGWLRLSQRAVSSAATELRPVITGTEADRQPLAPGADPVEARVEVLPFAHVFRRGSRLRVSIDTPGASRPRWRFDLDPTPVEVTVHSDPDRPSKLVLPVIPGIVVPTERPACGN
ncbi:MAG: CocE/NonD family hydrolase, partial [Acidimicrobiales bacterium]